MDRLNILICGAALSTELDIKDYRPHCENGAPYARAEVFFCWLDRSGVATLGTGVALIFEQWVSGDNALEGR